MPKPNVHVLLVSAQAAPNMLPALDPKLKPKEAILLVTQKMAKQADRLTAVLTESGVKVTRVEIPNEHDFGDLEKVMLNLAATREGSDIALNVTGGTKLMALAAQAVAQAAHWRTFYVDVDTDEVIWIGKGPKREKLAHQLRLRPYLRGYGFTLPENIDRPRAERRHTELLATLVTQVGSLEAPLGQLNFLAQETHGKRERKIRLTEQQQKNPTLSTLLRNFADANVLELNGDEVHFCSEADLVFANGGWLEQYVYQTVERCHGELGVRDKAANLVVTADDGVKNELDVAFLANNRLFVIECKTARMDSDRSGKANDTLFKLAEIHRRIGGLGARGMLASYRSLAEPEKALAKALNITVVTGGELVRLDEKLKTWVRG